MTTINNLEINFIRMNNKKIIEYAMSQQHIHREKLCQSCNSFFSFVKYKRNKDEFIYRCMTNSCQDYKKYSSLRKDTFFQKFNLLILTIYQIILRYAGRTPRYALVKCFEINKQSVYKIISELVARMKGPDFCNDKLGGMNRIVQIDETMLNYKCKSHQGRSATNSTDALCIIEIENQITRVFACTIPDKRATTLIPIICSQVAAVSVIWTDEHRSYSRLSGLDFIHDSVCHIQFYKSINWCHQHTSH